jgi:4-amino-4-deoxy-L-arabinose transferase-like glycosyltransferase
VQANSDIIELMDVFKRALKSPIVWLSVFTLIYFLTRLVRLTALPIFTDEAIYIRWSQIGANDAGWRFISLTDGKQPLFTWFAMAALRIFHDPLFAGRFVSVGAGFVGMIGMFFLGNEIFKSKRIGIIASFLYLTCPFTLMYDRMALYDSLVAAFSIWNLYIAILLVRRIRLDIALIFGLTLGVGMLNKTSAFLSLYLLPATVILFDWSKKARTKRLMTWVGLCVLSAVLSQVVYSILRLSPFFYIVSQKDTLFVYPFSEWIKHPFLSLQGNLHGEFDWIINYLTIPVFVASLVPLLYWSKHLKEKLILFGWWFAPFFALALFGKVLYPRFVLFMAMPLLVMAASTVDWILQSVRQPLVRYAVLAVLFLPSFYISSGIIRDIASAHIPKSDVGQYINDWPSGWGTNEVVAFLQKESQKGPVAVYTEGTFGLFPYALEIYLVNNKNIEIHGVWPPPKELSEDMRVSASKKPTYYITNLTQGKPNLPLEIIESYQKGNNKDSHMSLYRVILPR